MAGARGNNTRPRSRQPLTSSRREINAVGGGGARSAFDDKRQARRRGAEAMGEIEDDRPSESQWLKLGDWRRRARGCGG